MYKFYCGQYSVRLSYPRAFIYAYPNVSYSAMAIKQLLVFFSIFSRNIDCWGGVAIFVYDYQKSDAIIP